ncbi:MAG TPA: MHYT domain-containing protein [Rhizomicrobium sp.]|nr:MHYT domain-containing protein [Rhizomicrobium sp.]
MVGNDTGILSFLRLLDIAPYKGSYDLPFVALSVGVAVLSMYVALSVADRIVASSRRSVRLIWTSVGAIVMGGGIWSMHFIGMLAFSLPCGVGYNPLLTLVSILPGVLASGVALFVLSRRKQASQKLLFTSALFMGAGIGAMHYSGMAAMEPAALLRYDIRIVALSVVVAVALAYLALVIRARLEHFNDHRIMRTLLPATVMGLAIAGMHYVAMESAIFYPMAGILISGSIYSSTTLALVIGFVSVCVGLITLGVASLVGRRELTTSLLAEIARREHIQQDLIRAREEAEAANAAKSQFLATMSHEIRTPLNGVIGIANLLASTELDPRQERLVTNLSRSGQALLSIISDVLDFSKIEAGRQELFESDFEPRELVADVADLFCESCTAKGLELVYFVAEKVPHCLRGDPIRTRQILVNLIGNALKFTERGEILVELGVAKSGDDEIVLSFSVQDTGIGIPAEKRPLLFQSFRQLDGSMTRTKGGTGLGLAISRQLTELMGGTIDVESEFGRGSRFHFTIRYRHSAQIAAPEPRVLERPLRILVAEANSASAKVLSLYFASWGLDPVFAGTAEEAGRLWDRAVADGNGYDVAIIDIKGLAEPGIELGRKLRAGRSITEVIFLIGMDRSMANRNLETVDAAATLTKPVRPSELFNSLAVIASNSRGHGVAPFYIRGNESRAKAHFSARILVAEDNPVNQDVATGILENMGCSVVIALNGAVAVRRLAKEKFDLVLMDCEMPVLDGLQATMRIREAEAMTAGLEGGKRTPIVALTAHALADVRRKCLEAGMDDFLTKPFDETQMSKALRRWIGHLERAPAAEPAEPVRRARPAESRQAREGSPIDLAALDNVAAFKGATGEALFKRVVSRFTGTAPVLATSLREHYAASDAEALWRIAHSLKSSASALGASRLAGHAGEIEQVAREHGVAAVKPLLAALDRELAAALKSLSDMTGEDDESVARQG